MALLKLHEDMPSQRDFNLCLAQASEAELCFLTIRTISQIILFVVPLLVVCVTLYL